MPLSCSPPQLKHCFIFWSALARFDAGQGLSLVHRARGCVCNRGITRSDRLRGKAVCAEADQTGACPWKSAVWVGFCILMLRVTFSSCPGVWQLGPTSQDSLVLRGTAACTGMLPEQGARPGDAEAWILAPRLPMPWAWLWSFVRNWQSMATGSWGAAMTPSLYSSFFFCGCQLTLGAPRRQQSGERRVRAWFSSFFISVSIKR